jgi:hypothetical protein
MPRDDDRIVAEGRFAVAYAVRNDGTVPAEAFFNGLSRGDQAYLLARFQHLAENGERGMHNRNVFRHERREIWGFKKTSNDAPNGGKGLIRIPCFREGSRWYLTHGFWKPLKDGRWRESDFDLAFAIMKEVVDRNKAKRDRAQ